MALIFATGLGLTGGRSNGVETLLVGMLILLLAALAWPVIAKFLTFSTAGASGSAGLGVVLGFVAGRLSGGGSLPGGGLPGGSGAGDGAAGAAAGEGAGGGAAAAGMAAGGAAAGILALAASGIQAAHRASTALAGRMDDVAGNAGLAPPGSGHHPQLQGARPRPGSGPATQQNRSPQAPGQAGARVSGDGWGASDWPEPEADPWSGGGWRGESPAPSAPATASPDPGDDEGSAG